MSAEENPNDELTEKIKILATDDDKIKSFGELFTNDSSREILQLLFNEELTAAQIAQRTEISLQLVKYHLNKLQDLGVVKISKIEKNSKSQDMKVYSATKFSIVIVPPKLSEKTKESKLLVRSFRHIYKVVGLGISTGFAGLLSLSTLQQDKQIPVSDTIQSRTSSSSLTDESSQELESAEIVMSDESAKELESAEFMMSEESERAITASAPVAEPQSSSDFDLDVVASPEPDVSIITESDAGILAGSDLFSPLVAITIVLGSLTVYYLWKSLRKSQTKVSQI